MYYHMQKLGGGYVLGVACWAVTVVLKSSGGGYFGYLTKSCSKKHHLKSKDIRLMKSSSMMRLWSRDITCRHNDLCPPWRPLYR